MEPKHLQRGDKCPVDGGSFKAARVPTDAEFAKAFDEEHNYGLPQGTDTAPPDQRAELGELHRCQSCGYQTRFPVETPAAAPRADTTTPQTTA